MLHRGPYGYVLRTFFGDLLSTSSGRKFTEWALNKKGLTKHKQLTFKKKDKIRFIANKDEAAITGITESNHTVPDLEVNLPGYDILRCDRNRNSGGVACYIRKDLCFNT